MEVAEFRQLWDFPGPPKAADFRHRSLASPKGIAGEPMFDEACLTPLPNYTGRQIRRIRERENVSQVVFAHYLAVSKNLVSDCERGIKKPAGPTKRLLSIAEKRGLAALVA